MPTVALFCHRVSESCSLSSISPGTLSHVYERPSLFLKHSRYLVHICSMNEWKKIMPWSVRWSLPTRSLLIRKAFIECFTVQQIYWPTLLSIGVSDSNSGLYQNHLGRRFFFFFYAQMFATQHDLGNGILLGRGRDGGGSRYQHS